MSLLNMHWNLTNRIVWDKPQLLSDCESMKRDHDACGCGIIKLCAWPEPLASSGIPRVVVHLHTAEHSNNLSAFARTEDLMAILTPGE